MKKRFRLKRIPRSEAECREVRFWPGVSLHGRSTVRVECPFCHHKQEAFIWSFYGGGKRCENSACRAFLTPYYGAKDIVVEVKD